MEKHPREIGLEDQAQRAYTALCTEVHGVSTVSGATLPTWAELDQAVQDSWIAAVTAVEDAISPPPPPAEPPL